MALVEKKYINYFDSEGEKTKYVLDCIDKIIMLLPDYDDFYTYNCVRILYPNISERGKINSVLRDIDKIMVSKKFIEETIDKNIMHSLTDIGQKVKESGGYYKYLEKMKEKDDLKTTKNFITNKMIGNNNSFSNALGSNISISSTNNNTLNDNQRDELKVMGVQEAEIEDLNNIISDDKKNPSEFSKKINSWLSSATAGLASRGIYEHTPKLIEFVHQFL